MAQLTIERTYKLALQYHQAGRLGEAEQLYRDILTQQPDHTDALHFFGILAHQAGRIDLAIELIGRAIFFRPDYAEAHCNLGVVLAENTQLDEAVAAFRRATALKADYAQAHSNLGEALRSKGQFDEAIIAYRQAISLRPSDAEAHGNLGIVLARNGQLEQAVGVFGQAIMLSPGNAQAHANLGNALWTLGHLDAAIASLRVAVQLKPDLAEAHNNLGNALWQLGQFDEAIASCRHAIKLKSDLASAHFNLGNALKDAGQLDRAIDSYRQAIQLNPDYAEAHNNLGVALQDAGQLDLAMASYRQAIRFKPDNAEAHSSLILLLNYNPNYDARMIAGELARWNDQHARPLEKSIQPHLNNRDPARRLRIGYVSADFRSHVVGRNLLPLFREHDHARMEIFCYANVAYSDALTEQFQRYADAWRAIAGLSARRIVELIRQDNIDILVDLSLHTAGNRLLVFAQKPAPVQVTFAGYPGSTGLRTIDYRLTDPNLDPPGLNDEFYSEKSFRLPDSFWCYQPADMEPVNALPAQTNGCITFGCLNNFCKVNEAVVKLWTDVLNTVCGSRLILLCPHGGTAESTREMFRRKGIESDRVEMVSRLKLSEYIKLYHRIDIGLDTFPYNGHTTSLDALWMGVPVVTLVGATVVGRAGLSQLTNLGLTELVAHSEQEYVRIAGELAGDLPRLIELRSTLRPRVQQSPLMDAHRFARNIEMAYHQIWKTWCEDIPTAS